MTRILLVVTCLAALEACERSPHELILVTPSSPIDRSIVEDLGELFESERVLTRVRLTEEPLSEEAALDAIASGAADIALVSNNLAFRRDIATVMPLYPTVLHIARRAGNDALAGPELLRDAAVFAGTEGSASRLIFERIVERIGLEDDEYRYISNTSEMADVVVVFAPISPEQIANFPDLVLSSIGTPDDVGAGGIVDAAVLLNPNFRPFVIPMGTYGDATPDPIVTIAVDKILVTRNNLDSSVVYDLIHDILRLRPALAAKRPGLFQQLSEDFDASRSRFILHPGTQAYLQRSAPTVYERYSGVAEVGVTLIVALGSAFIAVVRIFRVRRKNRIDRFYAATIDVRRTIKDSNDPAERQQAIVKVRELQNEAFDLLVDEKLAADESFRIFITLSNDVLRQLGAAGIDDHLSDA
ncbi:MAG: hypothetical protein OEU90_11455 [Gammaproteobacteria bacterium]|nr:hypothetical protein [Gammaproteobacteria bacterium]MDH3806070.1 hypothetical protein [Gammaproteobacteria bacterium]